MLKRDAKRGVLYVLALSGAQSDHETSALERYRRRGTMKFKTLCIATMTLLTVVAAVRLAAQARSQSEKKGHIRYKLIDIGTFGGPNSGNNGESIVMNSEADVTGFADTSTPDPTCFTDCFVTHAYRWRDGVLTDLGALPGGPGSATNGINSHDQIVGQSENGLVNPLNGIPELIATVWQDGKVIDLGTFGGNFSLPGGYMSRNSRGDCRGSCGALNATYMKNGCVLVDTFVLR